MQSLWKKEASEPHALFIDCFASVPKNFVEEVAIWLCGFRSEPKIISKNGETRKRKANQPLPEIVPKRSSRILEKQTNGIRQIYSKTERLRPKYEKRLQRFVPCLSYPPNKNYEDLANVLEVDTSKLFGRHIVANCDIDVGQIIGVAKPFSQIIYGSIDGNNNSSLPSNCLTCHKNNVTVQCERCDDVMFCSEECRSANKIHKIECTSISHKISDQFYDVKLAIQMVLTTVKTFSSAYGMINSFEKSNLAKNYTQHKWIMLNLTKMERDNTILRAYRAFECLMTMDFITSRFNTDRSKRFLMHLVLHYTAIIPANAFIDNAGTKSIYGTLSFFNHSCAPNACYGFKDGKGYIITIRPIKQDEQIFINYIGDKIKGSRVQRQEHIKRHWEFECKCERCAATAVIQPISFLIDDPHYRYIQNNKKDRFLPFGCKKRNRLRDECMNFLRKHGHCWTLVLDDVTISFLLSHTDDSF
ncbi:SET and MYND domain-containing protein DDB_G0273591-like [Contarinia nasturtii]|uniref:SET and MYND domain-containing protein DDB_G0273591-like n=1 Tax=Contarinia nasturtii TaxID=265458 RepID=UPI0012D3FD1C|nr:SET and MYND domain-containing protein DDB_G0273591-like [Contarinia nasturtii]